MPWLNSTDRKIQAFHWSDAVSYYDLDFIDGGGQPEAINYIDFLELSGRQQTARTIKVMMGDNGLGTGSNVVYNVWFADSKEELEDAVANKPPTPILYHINSLPQPVVLTFDVSTRYMAINFDPSYGNVDPTSTYISIYAY